MQWPRILALSCAVVLLATCSWSGADAQKQKGDAARQIVGGDVLIAAVQHLQNARKLRSDEFDVHVRRGRDNWAVSFTFLPRRPGFDVTVLVSEEGKVLRVGQGF